MAYPLEKWGTLLYIYTFKCHYDLLYFGIEGVLYFFNKLFACKNESYKLHTNPGDSSILVGQYY